MSRAGYKEPPIDPNYTGVWRMCSCGCMQERPLTHDYFATHTVCMSYGTYYYLQYQRRECRARIRKEQRNMKKEVKNLANVYSNLISEEEGSDENFL